MNGCNNSQTMQKQILNPNEIAKICECVYLSPFENHIIVIQVVLHN